MDIIDLLMEDHTKLRKELVKIRQNLSEPDARDQIKAFISNYEMHESIEEEVLFPNVQEFLNARPDRESLKGYHENHEEIWEILEELLDSLDTTRYNELQQVFFNFAASTEAHMSREERILFPAIRELVEKDTLEELGRKAEQRFTRFSYH